MRRLAWFEGKTLLAQATCRERPSSRRYGEYSTNSGASIPTPAPMEANLNPLPRGSRLDADHPEYGVRPFLRTD